MLSLLLSLTVYGQGYHIFTSDKELSSSLVNDIYHDSNNMIWISTEDGLNRYDGTKFIQYKDIVGDPHSIAHNYVRNVFEDSQGHIFVGTYAGVQLYDPNTDSFSPLATDIKTGETMNSFTTAIIERKNGEVWVSGNVIYKLLVVDGLLKCETLDLPVPSTLVENIIEDSSGNLWVMRESDGVYKLSPENQVTHYGVDQGVFGILTMTESLSGEIYGGSLRNGLFKYDPKSDKFVSINYHGESNLPVKRLYPLNAHTLYISTDGMGVKEYDERTGLISDTDFGSDLFDPMTAKVHSVKRDEEGNLWLAVYQKGVMLIPMQSNGFKYWGSKSSRYNIVGEASITSFCYCGGKLFVGTDNDGIYAVTPGSRQSTHYPHTSDPTSPPAIVMSLFEDSRGTLWVGSYTNGAAIMDKVTGRCRYVSSLLDNSGKPVRNVYGFAEDSSGKVWIATMGAGLFCYDARTGEMSSCLQINEMIGTEWICSICYCTRRNRLYLGTYIGVYAVDMNNPNSTVTRLDSIEKIVHTVDEDEAGNVWFGTSDGLYRLDLENQTRRFTVADGLCSNSVYAIEGDDAGDIWVSTNEGLSRFYTKTGDFVNYYVSDGLQGNEFCKNASLKVKNGTLLFGGIYGVTLFNPHEIVSPYMKWNVRITDIYVNGNPVKAGVTLSGGKPVMDKPPYETDKFRLAWPDKSFSIELATVEHNSPERLTFMYSIDDGVWISLPQGSNRIDVVNLPAGKFKFRYKVKDYLMESDVRQILITVSPPWWKTGWAKFLYVVLLLLAAFMVFLQIRRHYEVQRQMMEHEHAEQINEAKLQFFINIAHEIRTPMSLIISPLQRLMSMGDNEDHTKNYRIIRRNADRILRLVNDLLDVRKIDKGQMRLVFREVEIIGYINEVKDAFLDLAEQQKIDFTFTHEGIDTLPLWIDPKNFDKVLINVISNAFKFTPDEGSININLSLCSSSNQGEADAVRICVTDSGIGIPQSELEHVFDRFYQIRNDLQSYKPGSGVGLHLTRSLVELHHGSIHAECLPDNQSGTRFIIDMPLGNRHLEKEIMESSQANEGKQHKNIVLTPLIDKEGDVESDSHQGKPRTRYHIMIVEDDEEIRRYITDELSQEYHIVQSVNGREALELILRGKAPDLVITDVMMPEMDGMTLCRKIKQHIHLNHIPVVILTAKTSDEDNMEGMDVGADAYITKPFNIGVLAKTVDNLLRGREKLRNVYSGNQQAYETKLEKIDTQSPDERLMDRIMRSVNAHIGDPELTVETIASEVGLSRSHLHRKLKELTNQTTRDFIRNVRLKQAAQMLAEKRHSISEVAELVGFTNMGNFSSAFKSLYGVSPSEYRERKENDVVE